MQNIDFNFLLEIAADAIVQAELNLKNEGEKKRWVNAIASGIRLFEERGNHMTWMADDKYLLIHSDSNQIYSANGVCSCKAYITGLETRNKPFPCRHRALARLVRIYFELTEKPISKPASTKESCSCKFNWSDKFTEKFCAKHGAEMEAEVAESASYQDAPYFSGGYSKDRKVEKVGNIRI